MSIIDSNQRPDIRPIGSSGTVLRSMPSAAYGVGWGYLTPEDIGQHFAINQWLIAPSAVLVGSSQSGAVPTYSFNGPAASSVITCSDSALTFQGTEETITNIFLTTPVTKNTVGASITYTMTAVGSGNTGTVVSGALTTWLQYQYYGVAYDLGSYTSGFILGLSNRRLNPVHATVFTASVTGGAKLWYAHRSTLGTPHFSNYYGGIEGGFTSISTGILLQNSAGYSEYYQLWVSDYAGIGTINLRIQDGVTF